MVSPQVNIYMYVTLKWTVQHEHLHIRRGGGSLLILGGLNKTKFIVTDSKRIIFGGLNGTRCIATEINFITKH